MGAVADRKVELVRRPVRVYPDGSRPVPVVRALPFYSSRMGWMTHRVRSAAVHTVDEWGHVALEMWCGQGGSVGSRRPKGWLSAEPPAERPVCGTCEGRAVG